MVCPIRIRRWYFLTSLLSGLWLVLVLGTQEGFAGGGCPYKKGTATGEKAAEYNCPHHSKAIQNTKSPAYACPMHPEVASHKSGNCDKCGMKLVMAEAPAEGNIHAVKVTNPADFKKVKRYTCSMHSEVAKKRGGNCPECGMKLQKSNFYEVYVCPMKECPQISHEKGKCCGKKMNKKLMSTEEFGQLTQPSPEYICPMHPEVSSDDPGSCSKCGMRLKKSTSLDQESSKM